MPNGSGRPSNFAPEGGGMRDGRVRSTAAPFNRWRPTLLPTRPNPLKPFCCFLVRLLSNMLLISSRPATLLPP